MPQVSVLIPAYNMHEALPQCLDSVLKQDFTDFELIAINDGSTDDTADILRSYASRDSRMRVVDKTNGGLSNARNIAIQEAEAPLVAFIDADDWVEKDYLSYLLNVREQTGCACVGCNHIIEAGDRRSVRFPESEEIKRLSLEQAYMGVLYHGAPDVSAWGKLCERSIMTQIRYPEGRLFEDTARIAELLSLSEGIGMGYRPLYHYRYSETSLSKSVSVTHVWDFMDAVEHMTGLMSEDMFRQGCIRRRVHAALSTLRLSVNGGAPDWSRALKIIQKNALSVLRDKNAPRRDKLGIIAACSGKRIYDSIWKLYSMKRKSY